MNPAEAQSLLDELEAATVPVGGTVSLFPQDLGITNEVVFLTLDYLVEDVRSARPSSFNIVRHGKSQVTCEWRSFLQGVLDVMNNVLDSGNENGWTAFMEVRELHYCCHESFNIVGRSWK